MKKLCTDEEFIKLFKSLGAEGTSRAIGVAVRDVYRRRRSIEKEHDTKLVSPNNKVERHVNEWRCESRKRLELDIEDGVLMIGSDFHIWPGYRSVARRAMVKLAPEVGVTHFIANGDVLDLARISRHSPTGWVKAPTVREELEATQEALEEIRQATKNAYHLWTWGNHDYRFEAQLAEQASSFEGVKGFALPDHFPEWKFGISIWINGGDIVVKHRYKGGVHATHNNTVASGSNIFTGHLHSLKVTPYDDYRGTRYGVDTGTANDVYGPHTEYNEDNPQNCRSGFIITTINQGKMLMPEIVAVHGPDTVQFRGKIIKV